MSRWSLGRHTISAHVGGRPYPEEFKAEAVKQITERGHKVADVSAVGSAGRESAPSLSMDQSQAHADL